MSIPHFIYLLMMNTYVAYYEYAAVNVPVFVWLSVFKAVHLEWDLEQS